MKDILSIGFAAKKYLTESIKGRLGRAIGGGLVSGGIGGGAAALMNLAQHGEVDPSNVSSKADIKGSALGSAGLGAGLGALSSSDKPKKSKSKK